MSALFGLDMDAATPAAATGDATPKPRGKTARAGKSAPPEPTDAAPKGAARKGARSRTSTSTSTADTGGDSGCGKAKNCPPWRRGACVYVGKLIGQVPLVRSYTSPALRGRGRGAKRRG